MMFGPAVSACTELTEQVHAHISYNVNSLKWTGDCFYGLQTFLEALANQVGPMISTHTQHSLRTSQFMFGCMLFTAVLKVFFRDSYQILTAQLMLPAWTW